MRLLTLALVLAAMLTGASTHVYELRTYHANPGKLPDLEARFRDHTITIFNKHHMKSVGYWIPNGITRTKFISTSLNTKAVKPP